MYVARTPCPIGLTGYASPTRAYTPWTAGTGLRSAGCKCGGSCAGCGGMGRHRHGMGLFDTADFTTWGWGEWLTIGAGVYFVLSLAGDTSRAVKSTRKASKRVRQRLERAGIGRA
jgi:hypothetical protein